MAAQEELSVDELKAHLRDSFRQKGVLDSVKANLRARFMEELRFHPAYDAAPGGGKENGAPPSLRAMSLNCLFAEHLRDAGLRRSLSVFLPESGVAARSLSRGDILRALELDPSSALYRRLSGQASQQRQTRLLDDIIAELASQGARRTMNSMTQTEESVPERRDVLARRLQEVQSQFLARAEHERLAPARTIEQRMALYQQEVDARAERHVRQELDRMREGELRQMRLEEAARYRRELDAVRGQIERDFADRSRRLREREQELDRHYEAKQSELEAAAFSERQGFLSSLASVRSREDELKRAQQLDERQRGMEESRLRDRERELAQREARMTSLEDEAERRAEARFDEWKAATLQSLDEREQEAVRVGAQTARDEASLRTRKQAFEASVAQLERLRVEHPALEREHEALKRLCDRQEGEIAQLREQLSVVGASAQRGRDEAERADRELADARAALTVARADAHAATTQLADAHAARDERVKQLTADLAATERQLEELRRTHAADVDTMRQQAQGFIDTELREWRAKEADWWEGRRLLQADLGIAQARVEALEQRTAEDEAAIAALRDEAQSLRALLHQTRNAMDVATRPGRGAGRAGGRPASPPRRVRAAPAPSPAPLPPPPTQSDAAAMLQQIMNAAAASALPPAAPAPPPSRETPAPETPAPAPSRETPAPEAPDAAAMAAAAREEAARARQQASQDAAELDRRAAQEAAARSELEDLEAKLASQRAAYEQEQAAMREQAAAAQQAREQRQREREDEAQKRAAADVAAAQAARERAEADAKAAAEEAQRQIAAAKAEADARAAQAVAKAQADADAAAAKAADQARADAAAATAAAEAAAEAARADAAAAAEQARAEAAAAARAEARAEAADAARVAAREETEAAAAAAREEAEAAAAAARADAAAAKAKAKAEAKAEVEAAAAAAKAEADAKAEAEAQAKAEAEAQAKAEADAQAKAKAEADAQAQAEAEAKAKAEADAQAKADADAKLEALRKRRAEQAARDEELARERAAERERAEAEAKREREAAAKAEEERLAEEARQREAEAAARLTEEEKAEIERKERDDAEIEAVRERMRQRMFGDGSQSGSFGGAAAVEDDGADDIVLDSFDSGGSGGSLSDGLDVGELLQGSGSDDSDW